MSKVSGNANLAVVANAVELATEAISLYVRKTGRKELFGEHVNRQLIADTVTQRLASNIRIENLVKNSR
jgi:Zn-dependent alcohol dehydrogenase